VVSTDSTLANENASAAGAGTPAMACGSFAVAALRQAPDFFLGGGLTLQGATCILRAWQDARTPRRLSWADAADGRALNA